MNQSSIRRASALTVSTVILASLTVATVAAPVVAKADKTTVCHKPGTTAEKTLKVAAPALKPHLAHGDYLADCGVVDACTAINDPARDSRYPSIDLGRLDFVGDEQLSWMTDFAPQSDLPFTVTIAGVDYHSQNDVHYPSHLVLHSPPITGIAAVAWATDTLSEVKWYVDCRHVAS